MFQSDPDGTTLTQDEVYELLSNARRRFVISYLRGREEPVPLSELSDAVASWENEVPAEELTDQQVKRVYVSLYQTHLPKLSDFGLVEYDRDEGTVELTESVRELDTYLPDQQRSGQSWAVRYAAVAVVGLALDLVALVALPPAAQVLFGVATILAFAALAVAHYLQLRRA